MILRFLKKQSMAVQGISHIKKGVVCQDKTFYSIKNGCYCASLCDGAGSRKYSHIGAEIVSKTACDFFSEKFDDVLLALENKNLNELFMDFYNRLMEKENDYISLHPECSVNDLLCTLLFVIIKDNRYVIGHCGDGVIAAYRQIDDGRLLDVLSCPENGDVSNITYFVNESESILTKHLRISSGYINDIKGFIMMSDGPEEYFYKNGFLNSNAKLFFDGLEGTSDEDSKSFYERILKEKVSKISVDDLSVNVLFFDVIDSKQDDAYERLETLPKQMFQNQFIQESSYSFLLDLAKTGDGLLVQPSSVFNYLESVKL